MSTSKNQSNYQNTAFLLVEIQIMIDFLCTDMMRKKTFKLGTSLVTRLDLPVFQRLINKSKPEIVSAYFSKSRGTVSFTFVSTYGSTNYIC